MAALGGDPGLDPRAEDLLRRGWQWHESAPCPGLSAGRFYEAQGKDASAELLYLGEGKSLASRETWPEEPVTCSEEKSPTEIQEVP